MWLIIAVDVEKATRVLGTISPMQSQSGLHLGSCLVLFIYDIKSLENWGSFWTNLPCLFGHRSYSLATWCIDYLLVYLPLYLSGVQAWKLYGSVLGN